MDTGHAAYGKYHHDAIVSQEKDQEDSVVCPSCKQDVTLIRYGNGWVGVCCGRLAYSGLTGKKNQKQDSRA